MAIVTLVLWVITAAAGFTLLRRGGAARQAGPVTADPVTADPVTAGSGASSAAIPCTGPGKPPPLPRTRVTAPPGEHPLLEFSHPALAIVGLACWLMFVFIRYPPLAWLALGVLVVTLCAGLGWQARNARATRRRASSAWLFPQRLLTLHGLAAAVAIALTVLTALSASRA